MNGYDLSRAWFDWCFENPEKICPNHTALYFFIIEQCNRLGWKEKFGLPSQTAKDAIGISNYRTYTKTLNDLVEWGFIEIIEKSTNQWTSTIIAIAKNTKAGNKAPTKALDKALYEHVQKQVHGTVSIDKHSNNKQLNLKTIEQRKEDFSISLNPFLEKYTPEFGLNGAKDMLNKFYRYWTESNPGAKKFRAEKQPTWDLTGRIRTWADNEKKFSKNNGQITANNHLKKSVDEKRAGVHSLASESYARLVQLSGEDDTTGGGAPG